MSFCGKAQTTDSLVINPLLFDSTATFSFYPSTNDTVTLGVYNRWGQVIKSFLNNTVMQQSFYSVVFYGDSLTNGNYYVVFKHNGKNGSRIITKNATTTSINKTKQVIGSLHLSPNPTKGQLAIPLNGTKKITIVDTEGRIIKTITTPENNISISDLKAGNYFISIFSNENKLLLKEQIIKID